MHEAVRSELNAQRAGTAATKSRGLVSGGRAKPWRQKGTGRARQGTIRAPQFEGGGHAFAKVPRTFIQKVNRKAAKAALRSALASHASARHRSPSSTADAVRRAVDEVGARASSKARASQTPIVIVAHRGGDELRKRFRNLQRVAVIAPSELEVGAVVWARSLLVSEAALPLVDGEGVVMHASQVILAPIVSEKSYAGATRGSYTFKVHPDAHKTQIRQAVEELFDVKVERVNVIKVQAKPKRRGALQGHAPRLEEGRRATARRRHDRDLRGSADLMPVRRFKPTSPGRRHMTVSDFAEVTKSKPEKALTEKLTKKGGRNNTGRITTRHQGGGHKRRYRIIDFKRTKDGVPAKVAAIEYDPNRSARIALLHYADGFKATSSRPPACASARSCSPAPTPTSSPATRCRSRTSRPARSCTTSS